LFLGLGTSIGEKEGKIEMENGEGKIREFKIESNEMTKPILQNISDSNLSDVVKFFLIFSRFEYALKEAGFLKNAKAKPAWDSFSDKINGYLPSRKNEYDEFRNAIDYLNNCPPRIQIVKHGTKLLDWKCYKPQGNEARVLTEYIRRIRNNLFYGGKIPFDPTRDSKLIKSATTILKHFLELDAASTVKRYYK